jgi:hypothetical protein
MYRFIVATNNQYIPCINSNYSFLEYAACNLDEIIKFKCHILCAVPIYGGTFSPTKLIEEV